MEVILLEKIDNVGGIGDQVKVKPGFARNFLIPQGKATMATAQNIQKFEKVRKELEAKAAAEVEAARARAVAIEGKDLTISVQAGSEGRLFGSVGTIDIAEAYAAIYDASGLLLAEADAVLMDVPQGLIAETDLQQLGWRVYTDTETVV